MNGANAAGAIVRTAFNFLADIIGQLLVFLAKTILMVMMLFAVQFNQVQKHLFLIIYRILQQRHIPTP